MSFCWNHYNRQSLTYPIVRRLLDILYDDIHFFILFQDLRKIFHNHFILYIKHFVLIIL